MSGIRREREVGGIWGGIYRRDGGGDMETQREDRREGGDRGRGDRERLVIQRKKGINTERGGKTGRERKRQGEKWERGEDRKEEDREKGGRGGERGRKTGRERKRRGERWEREEGRRGRERNKTGGR